MSRFTRLSLLAAAAAALTACGGGGAKIGGGKEGAAKAMYEASTPASKAGQSSAQGMLPHLASAATVSGETTVRCSHGGSLKSKMDLSSFLEGNGEELKFKSEIEYDECNEDGINTFDGKLTMEFRLGALGGDSAMELKFKGKLELSGEIDDFLDMDVTQSLAVTTTPTSGSVSLKLLGTIKTSEGTYTYDGTPLSISVEGHIPAADDSKS